MTNKDVVKAWIEGRPEAAPNLSTDGKYLYSYMLRIGYTLSIPKMGEYKIAIGFLMSDGCTRTTRHHILQAYRECGMLVDPTEVELLELSHCLRSR